MVNKMCLDHIIVICIVTECGWLCHFMWRVSGYDKTTTELYYHLMLSNGLSNLQTNATKLQSHFGFKMSRETL